LVPVPESEQPTPPPPQPQPQPQPQPNYPAPTAAPVGEFSPFGPTLQGHVTVGASSVGWGFAGGLRYAFPDRSIEGAGPFVSAAGLLGVDSLGGSAMGISLKARLEVVTTEATPIILPYFYAYVFGSTGVAWNAAGSGLVSRAGIGAGWNIWLHHGKGADPNHNEILDCSGCNGGSGNGAIAAAAILLAIVLPMNVELYWERLEIRGTVFEGVRFGFGLGL
jgi:hypothetical protein